MENAMLEGLRKSSNFFWSSKIRLENLDKKGVSVICSENIDENELIIVIPPSVLLNNEKCTSNYPETHGAIALELLKRKKSGDMWIELMPQSFSFMPLYWDTESQQKLPLRYQATIKNQLKEIQKITEFSGESLEDVKWAFCAVNSRCLYWPNGGMTMAPAIDFLNHTCDQESSLKVTSDLKNGIRVYTTRKYHAEEELVFCYGPHENGALLVEYGFCVENNNWDFLDITELVIPLVEPSKSLLEELGYFGDYTINTSGELNFRVLVALSTLFTNGRRVKQIALGYDDGEEFLDKCEELVKGLLREQHDETSDHFELQLFLNEQRKIKNKIIN